MSETKRVQFLRSHNGYNAGEVAGFSAEEADRLVAAGVAQEPSSEAVDRADGGEASQASEEPEEGRSRRRGRSSDE